MLAINPAASQVALEGLNLTLVIAVLVISIIALVMGAMFRGQVLAADPGTPRMQEIGAAVEEGAQAYLNRQFKTLGGFVVLVFLLLFLLPADMNVKIGRSVFFVIGALFSAAIGYLGMSLAVKANVRVASASSTSRPPKPTRRRAIWSASRPTCAWPPLPAWAAVRAA